ncbi:PREDICTED: acyl-CoA synthetase family member 2, mitochondrial [Wasmannia auropunctata]|uniref:acyl-CoA synthetase family member 2, mitochondrial n=1 Tax=Wasmannia auropunctata TaxID=64793 RepID=UPI0005F00444|nr:PREDICTED: acyl-CoA synthetase family member 2, mitochondrial [Wasmannia auropunctata]XP_011692139.1 PREDICTED: acyl-CoA synthetase family member 2, mitochondrial [Wasmannia auropunctata]XP_011692140.1 PREDICTED: acyl-CoA synthetase family member 2, mitochondrial [Wasmannia auropunctata]XP_011692141.1 PREDICTED: acyl-CoA synthetase family member 2, mitochondrial [Wasmannia auropunctata]XP_011692142.1 PREDICTED: acyl-CoA synthetase family member 2, mitochondrial [Wasmannia auropunctata]XP_01
MLSSFKTVSRYIASGILNHQNHLRCFSMLHPNFKERCQLRRSTIQGKVKFSHAIKAAHMYNPGEFPLMDKTVGQLLSEAVATWPDRTCIVSIPQNVRLTFTQLLRRVDSVAAGLKRMGLKKGDRLGLWGPNDLEWFITFLAASRVGLIVVAINPAYQQNELVYCLQKVGVKATVSPETFKTQNYPKMLFAAKEVCPTLEHIIIYSPDYVTGTHRFADVEVSATKAEVDAIAAEQDTISCYDGCNIQFTSGSTGKAKATLLSHRSLVNNSMESARRVKITIEDKICLNMPLYHAFGMSMGQLLVFNMGNTLVLEGRSFDPVKTLEAVAQEKCTITYGTPTMWVNLLEAQQRLQLPTASLQAGITGGAPASSELFKRIRDLLGFNDMTSIYGLTETTAIVFQSIRGEDRHLSETTVGYLSNHTEAMIVDQNGLPVPFGKTGELWIRAYSTMMRYWDDEENTRKTMTEDGWLKTGDQFVLQENGYATIVGRLKDMLIRGGENIFPKEIEDFLVTHPKVMQAQVIGAYDEVYGEEICACIQLRNGATMTKNELTDYCRGKIAHFKIPRYVEFVNEYPKTTTGKIQKFRLKEQMENSGVIPKHL